MKTKFLEIFEPVGFFMALIAMVAGILCPLLWWDSKLAIVLIVAAVSFIYGSFIFRLARNGLWIAFFVILFLVALNWIGSQESEANGSMGIRITWILFGLSGVIVGGSIVHHFSPKRSKSKTSQKLSKELTVLWKDGRKLAENEAPSAASLEERVRALDGKKRALVSAMRGSARMDFCGDADGAMVVYFSPDRSDDRLWSMMTTPGTDLGQIEVVIGDLEGAFENWETTSVEPAVAAARHFASTGQADPELTWYASKDVCERRPLAS